MTIPEARDGPEKRNASEPSGIERPSRRSRMDISEMSLGVLQFASACEVVVHARTLGPQTTVKKWGFGQVVVLEEDAGEIG